MLTMSQPGAFAASPLHDWSVLTPVTQQQIRARVRTLVSIDTDVGPKSHKARLMLGRESMRIWVWSLCAPHQMKLDGFRQRGGCR